MKVSYVLRRCYSGWTLPINGMDTDARRYFKQSEIVLYRLAPEYAATPQIAQQQQLQQQLQQEQQEQHRPLPGAATPGPGRQQSVVSTPAA